MALGRIVNGICYDGFPAPYNPSTANQTCIFFGSDAAYDAMKPLWGASYTSSSGSSCGTGGAKCRHDLKAMADLGVQLIRLYDWDPRNPHHDFLNECNELNMGVLVSVSNYFLQADAGYPDRATKIPALLRSFANHAGTDYHPIIAGVVFGNELAGYGAEQCVTFTQDWVRLETSVFPNPRRVRLGHPVQFAKFGARFPCFGFWDQLLPPLKADPAIAPRLFLAPQTYNDAAYLFQNAENSGVGWVDQAWQAYATPILFTEIGLDRTQANYQKTVHDQLQGVQVYNKAHPDRLLASCFFQYADKVWMEGTSEGSYGVFSHTNSIICTIRYTAKDFTHWEVNCDGNTLNVDELTQTGLFAPVTAVYRSQGS